VSERLKIGWIGCGTHANEMLLPQLTRLPFEIAALCDTDEARLAGTAARFNLGADRLERDWRTLLARPGLEAIGVAVGPALHPEIGKAAIARGLPAFLEKPPAATAAAASELADASRRTRVPVVLGFMKRYSTANRIAANVLRKPDFGRPASFLGQYMTAPTYFERDPDYSGFYLHHCVHYMDLVPYLMGEVESLTARRHELAPGKLLLHVDFRFSTGAIGTLVMGTHQSRGTPVEWWQVMGDHRRIEVRNVHEVRYYRSPSLKLSQAQPTLTDGEDALLWEPNLTVAANEDHKGYAELLADFLRAARGEPNEAPTAADGARAMRLLDAVIARS
jgi:myo-inositol 2-dehydrogenase / D-chiro-inositol 1-dehydrogenase